MARIDAEDFEDQQSELDFIAMRTREAQRVESLFCDQGIDYALAFEPFLHRGLLGTTTLTGVGFYVPSARAQHCRELLQRSGLAVGVVEELG